MSARNGSSTPARRLGFVASKYFASGASLLAEAALGALLAGGAITAAFAASGGMGAGPSGGAGGLVGVNRGAGGTATGSGGGGGGGASGGGGGGGGGSDNVVPPTNQAAGGSGGDGAFSIFTGGAGGGGGSGALSQSVGNGGASSASGSDGGAGSAAGSARGGEGGQGGDGGAASVSVVGSGNTSATAVGGNGGGGGDGGAARAFVSSGTIPSAGNGTVGGRGGSGGQGGDASAAASSTRGSSIATAASGSGGQGGGGGAALLLQGNGATFSLSGRFSGGDAGDGGGTGHLSSVGGTASTATFGIGGKGGAGGNAVTVTGAEAVLNNQADLIGGNGGSGGSGFTSSRGGNGGSGGGGVVFAGGGTLVNTGTIAGGRGGAGGGSPSAGGNGAAGAGGAGISGANLVIVNSGIISGGLPGDVNSANRANAITFTGGINRLELQARTANTLYNGIAGNVVVLGGATATLTLGGATNAIFGAGAVDTAAQYRGFSALQKTGTSTWTLTGTQLGTLAYQINGGILNLGSSGALGTAGTISFGGGTLQYSAANTTDYSGRFSQGANQAYSIDTNGQTVVFATGLASNGGSLTKLGAGTLRLDATNAYTGATSVNGGTFEVDGVVTASNITVNNGGTLSGIGKIGDPQINAGGTLAPGNAATPYGTLTIVGPLRFAAGSFYDVAIAPTGNSRTNVDGATTIAGGTVNVAAAQGSYGLNKRYTILNSTQSVTGSFAGVTTSTAFAFLTPKLSYDSNNVFLDILPSSPVPTPSGHQVPNYTTWSSNQNQFNVSSGLTEAGRQSNGRGKVLNALNQLTVPQARNAFDSLSGEGVTAAQTIAFRSAQLFTSAIFDQTTFYAGGGAANSVTLTEPLAGFVALAARQGQPVRELADLPVSRVAPAAPVPVATRTWRAWATGYGDVENISGNHAIGSAAQRNEIFGGALGVDYQLLPNHLIGVAVGGSSGDFRVNARGTMGTTTGGHIAIYDLYELGNWYGASSSSFSYFGNQTTRFVNGFGGLGAEQNRGNFNSNEFRGRLEIGRHFSALPVFSNLPAIAGFGTVTPFVAIELASLRSNGFTETPLKGGPGLFRLSVSGQSTGEAPGFVGLRFQRVIPFGGDMILSPTLQVAYVHEFAPYRNQVGTLASLPGSTFLVDGACPARDAAQVKAGTELAISPHSAIFANFDGEFSGVNQLYAGKGGFKYVW